MALGSSWGTREEMLHPRDRRGRFRKKWSMPEGLVNKLQAFLGRFSPRTFQSDNQASQYLANKAKPGRFPGDGEERLRFDWDEANDHLRAGDIDPSTQKFIQMMDAAEVSMPEQMILHRTVGPEAFGLTAEQLGLEDGGLEDFTGRLIADRAYSATNLGTPMGLGPGRIHMTIATPRGQRAIIPSQTPNDRGVVLPRDQGIRITRVRPDGRGGWDVMAIAEPKGVSDQTPEPVMPGRRGAGLSEAQREARLRPTTMTEQQRLEAAGNPPMAQRAAEQRGDVPAPAQPVPSQPAPPAPGVPERREPVQKQAVGPAATEGTSAGEIADSGRQMKEAEAQQQATPAPVTPDSFRRFTIERKVGVPSDGPRRKQWNNAYRSIIDGKKTPEDALRELESDIVQNREDLNDQTLTDLGRQRLERDLQAQEDLADAISEHYNLGSRGQATQAETPEAPAAPAKAAKKAGKAAPTKAPAKKAGAGPKPTPGAPSTSRESVPSPKVQEQRGLDRMTKPELLKEAGDAGRPRMTKAQLIQAIEAKRSAGEAPPAPAPAKKVPGSKFTPAQEEALVNRAKQFRGKERNDEERRIVAEADAILARREGKAPAKKATPGRSPEDQAKLVEAAKANIEAKGAAKAVAKKATPAKAAPTPEDAAEEAFKARVAEAGLPDRVTALKAMAKDQKIRGFSTMNKRQLQSALLGDEVPRAGKIGVVPPKKMIPHLEAADSDQAARALLKDHTLKDLKDLAKERELVLPKKGATKPRVMDMVLEDIRGVPETAGGEIPARSLREELEAQRWVEPADPAVADTVRGIISDTDEMDAADLRNSRDALEAMVKTERNKGNRQDANLMQTLADTMGMRAQTISGVEEAAPPVKRVAKKAAPEVPEGEEAPVVERPLEKMLKPELLTLAQKEGASVRPSWSKARILDEIKRKRRMDSSRGPETAEERLRRELGALPVDAVPRPPAPAKRVTKKAAKKAVADVDRAAQNLTSQLRDVPAGTGETFGDQLKRLDVEEFRRSAREQGVELADGKTAEEIFDNTIKKALEDRMRELGMLPEDPAKPTRAQKRVPKGSVKGPKADVPITTPDRRRDFIDSWNQQGLADDESMVEIRDRIADGEFTHEEGIRRLESEIAFNEEEMNDLRAELEGMAPEDRDEESGIADGIHARRAELSDAITKNKKAIKFLRTHAQNEAPITREELEEKLPDADKAALQRVEVDDLKAAAKADGLGNIEGDDRDTVVANIARAMQAREAKNLEREQRARDRQASIDERSKVADALSNLDQMAQNGGSDKALQAGIRRLPAADQEQLTEALGDRNLFRQRLDTITKSRGLARFGTVGETVPYDPQKHDVVGDIAPGSPVLITRAGHDFRPGDGSTVSFKARAIPDTGAPVPAKKAAPSAPETPTGPRRPGQANPSAAVLKTGARILTMQDSDGKWTRTSRKTGSKAITVDRIDRVQVGNQSGYQIHGTDDDGNKVTMEPIFGQNTLTLAPEKVGAPETPAAPKKAAKFLPPLANGTPRKSFTNVEVGDVVKRAGSKGNAQRVVQHDRPTARGGSHILHLEDGSRMTGHPNTAVWLDPSTQGAGAPEVPAPVKKATKKAAQAARDEESAAGIRRLAEGGNNEPLIEGAPPRPEPLISRVAREVSEGLPPVKKTAKAAVPPAKKAVPKVVDLDNPTRHNAEVIGTGLDLEPKGADRDWLGIVQRDLDRGTDGRQIASDLRREADSQRTIHNIQEAIAPGTGGPAGRIDRMERMADRLEGVRPIQAPEAPAKAVPSGPAKREMGTMAAATAQSRALSDLKAGKSHTEVATALRQAATSVGSKDHDPQFVRPLEFSPAERSAMKRSDAKALRDLAAEIQAQGVAQRAATKAAKKAPAKKAAPGETVVSPAVDRMVRQGGVLPGQSRRLSELREAAAPAPKKRTAAEMRRARNAAEMEGVPVEEVLERWDKQKQDMKDLTGPVGEYLAKQIDDAVAKAQAAPNEQEARLAIFDLRIDTMRTLADRLGITNKGGGTVPLATRIVERLRGTDAPTTSAERAVPKVEAPSAGAVDESVPLDKFPHDDNMRMHADSPTMRLAFAYEKAGRNGSANRIAKLRARTTTPSKGSERLTPQQLVEELRAMRAQETDPKFQRMLDQAIEANDAPMTPLPEIPADTPPLARQLLEDLHAIPYARKGPGSEGGSGLTHGPSLVDQLAEVYRDAGRGERGPERRHPVDRIRAILRNKIHELNDPSFRIWEMAGRFESDESSDTGKKVTELEKQIRDWERSHWPK